MAGRIIWVGNLRGLGSGVEVMVKKYRVLLTPEEQEELKGMVSRGRAAAYKQTHARILLLSDENQAGGAMRDQDIARALRVGSATVERVRRRCVEEGLERALGRKEQLNRRRKKAGRWRARPTWWPWPAPNRPAAGPVGRCICWLISWWKGR